jgi:hypothetical protein
MNAIGRREALSAIACALWAAACAAKRDGFVEARGSPPATALPPLDFTDDLDALFDVILPAERDAKGNVTTPGAREAGAMDVLRLKDFVPLATARGWIPPAPDAVTKTLADVDGAFRAALVADLDLRALAYDALTTFRDLPRKEQEDIVARAFDDPARRPGMLLVRAACFAAWLGAITSDLGLRAIGFPPFEDWDARLAVSGYPRTKGGRLVDPTIENLPALAASGQLDDYTFNRAPEPTPGEDLSTILDASGDLY